MDITLSFPCFRSDPPLSRQGAVLAHLDSLPSHDLVIWTDGSVPFPFGKGGSGVLNNRSLCSTEATLSFSADPVCSSFSSEACAILQALRSPWQHQQVCHLSSPPISVLSSPLCFLLSQTLWQKLSFLASLTIRLQWDPGHLFHPRNDTADELARLGTLLLPFAISCSFPILISRIHFFWSGGVPSHLNSSRRSPRFPLRNLCFFVALAVPSLVFGAMDTNFC